ncbi:DUF3999 family protein [Candidatus Methylomicrobium oryzae]|uniref:DUF3999 family protein n=1 Tax=Candidatus Methylomicrobium oryzae TaxID=2802053 RepID=UPI00192406E9|nr:DUF3999 family protein [Methylomicrobium sp. RS1]MBL1265017.1 DUF3999 family protein [Methylomicrobium sp. RS1]
MNARKTLFCVLLLTALAAGAETGYRFSRPVEWKAETGEVLLAVPLDSRIYAAARDGFPDIRIVDQNGTETPYLLEKAAESKTLTSRQNFNGKLKAVNKVKNSIEVYYDLEKASENADGLTVHTPVKNYEHRIDVFGSDDGTHWTPLVQNATIFDYSAYLQFDQRDIVLPKNTFRQFKVVVQEAAPASATAWSQTIETARGSGGKNEHIVVDSQRLQRIPLKIDRVDFWHEHSEVQPETEKKFDYSQRFTVKEEPETHTTLIDVTGSREPLTGFRLETTARNFNRPATVRVPYKKGIESGWQDVGSATLESVHFREFSREPLTLPFPEQRRDIYRIVIENADNPPLPIRSVTGIGNGYNLLFLPSPNTRYHLRYGARNAKPPRYETGPIQEVLCRGYARTPAALGPETAAPAEPESLDWVGILNSKLFLMLAAVIAVLVLVWSLVRVGRRVEELPRE